jgi:phosphopantothenoylcysteine decarboxylase / phosphopantothenate---cysteine ligase
MLGRGPCGKPAEYPGAAIFCIAETKYPLCHPNPPPASPHATIPNPDIGLSLREKAPLMNPPRVLITAGPTHEPIDEVRYLANRSSGRVGIEIAEAALDAGWMTTLALGPTPIEPRTTPNPNQGSGTGSDTHARARRFQLIRFRTTADLQKCLEQHAHLADILIMAAAVADYRPAPMGDGTAAGKLRRSEEGLTLHLESTPDLVAACASRRSQQQDPRPKLIVGFALEPAAGVDEAAFSKLRRKGIDLIVANPLETMDSNTIEATVFSAEGAVAKTRGPIGKSEFGRWLVELLASEYRETARRSL